MSDDISSKIKEGPEIVTHVKDFKMSTEKQSMKKAVIAGIVVLVTGTFFLSGNKSKISKKLKALAPPVLSNLPTINITTSYNLEDKLTETKPPKKRIRRKVVRYFEGAQVISRPFLDEVAPGTMVKAKLLTGASEGFIKAVSMSPAENNGEEVIPAGSVFIGVGSSKGSRLYVNFTKVVLPDSSVKPIRALASDLTDKVPGVKGSRIGGYGLKLAASSALNFAAGLSAGLQQRTAVGGVVVEDSSLRNAALNGSSKAAVELSKEVLSNAKETSPKVQVKEGTSIYILFK